MPDERERKQGALGRRLAIALIAALSFCASPEGLARLELAPDRAEAAMQGGGDRAERRGERRQRAGRDERRSRKEGRAERGGNAGRNADRAERRRGRGDANMERERRRNRQARDRAAQNTVPGRGDQRVERDRRSNRLARDRAARERIPGRGDQRVERDRRGPDARGRGGNGRDARNHPPGRRHAHRGDRHRHWRGDRGHRRGRYWRGRGWRPPHYRAPYYRRPHPYWGDYYYSPFWGWYFTAPLAAATLVYVATPPADEVCEPVFLYGERHLDCGGVLYRPTSYRDEIVYEILPESRDEARPSRPGVTMMLTSPRMRGEDIRELQYSLRSRGYLPGPADGVFGPATERAVREFQRNRGLRPTGRVDAETARQLEL
ncbi:hypothetical protein G5B40_06740 [Pikeienuella piscinae]|uniref:Peptidoglycan binding-like domain-containing protein n=1 Tax=Pikeienuella piscinae TaxID=2748098 RepID=A0A7L5BZ63_9RHOB|nr:peptidoglycan-binding domain-containing protein [Pikeienuella piscinae]QIE55174.1 hypothetical protein G5B40_06740 [Pikeienuella piscinae]